MSTWTSGCLTCGLYIVVTALGSFFAGTLVRVIMRLLRQRLLQNAGGKKEASVKSPKAFRNLPAVPSKPIGPPPKRRHSLSVTSSGEHSSMAILAARHNRANRSTVADFNTADNMSSAPTVEDSKDEEERDVARPLSTGPRGFSAIRQKGRSFAASLRKLTLLHDNSVEQVSNH